MRAVRLAAVVLGAAALLVAGAGSASAGPVLPKDCHEWNDLLGIDNVRSCEDPDPRS